MTTPLIQSTLYIIIQIQSFNKHRHTKLYIMRKEYISDKWKFRNSGNETFYYYGKSYKFDKNDPTLFFLQRLRDEAHRFAINAHRSKRSKGISKSLLDKVAGIGSVRKRALLNHFGSARAVESASLDEIKSVEGVEEKVAKKIYNFFHEWNLKFQIF